MGGQNHHLLHVTMCYHFVWPGNPGCDRVLPAQTYNADTRIGPDLVPGHLPFRNGRHLLCFLAIKFVHRAKRPERIHRYWLALCQDGWGWWNIQIGNFSFSRFNIFAQGRRTRPRTRPLGNCYPCWVYIVKPCNTSGLQIK